MRGIVPIRGITPAHLSYPALRNGMGQLFETLFDGNWEASEGSKTFVPAIDVKENEDALLVTADLPGIDPESIDVSINDGLLTIQGERKSDQETTEGQSHLIERRFGAFRRSFTLPSQVDIESIEATHDHGVLTIKLPKDVAAKTKKISVRSIK